MTQAACSTFAFKYENNSITVTVRDSTASGISNADSVKVRIRSDPRTIQPRPTDTTITVSRGGVGGVATLTGVRDGYYIVSTLHDSINAAGDTVYAFGTANNGVVVDANGPAGSPVVNIIARRGDTQIQGFVANDRDTDFNTVDPGEGLAGVTLKLYKDNSGTVTVSSDSLVKTTTTDANGAYAFTGLREGTYVIQATSPTGAIVLRRFSGTGTAVDTAIVHTTGVAATTCQIGDNLRRVGSNDQTCYSAAAQLPSWNYSTSAAQNVGAGTAGPASFTFLYSTGTATGLVRKADLTAVSGMQITLRRCLVVGAAPNSPAAGSTCGGSYDTSFAAVTTATDSSGKYTYTALREGVYEIVPNATSVTGFSSTTPTSYLVTINQPNDIETGNFTANP
jgi:hypothetical protein